MFSLFLHLSIRSNDSFKRIESMRMCEGKLVKDKEHCEKEADKLDFQKQKLEQQRTLFDQEQILFKKEKDREQKIFAKEKAFRIWTRPLGSGEGLQNLEQKNNVSNIHENQLVWVEEEIWKGQESAKQEQTFFSRQHKAEISQLKELHNAKLTIQYFLHTAEMLERDERHKGSPM